MVNARPAALQQSENTVIPDREELLDQIRAIHAGIRDAVVFATERQALEQLAEAVAEEGGDTIFAIDRVSESVILERFAALAERWPMVLIAEGLGESGGAVLPEGAPESAAALRVIVDPIDGTRGLMYDKRSAWALAGVAPNRGPATRLRDVEVAVMTELPTSKMGCGDVLWAVKGRGAHGERLEFRNGGSQPLALRPSQATGIDHGFASVASFFPGTKVLAAELMEHLVRHLVGPADVTKATVFDDQ